MSTVEDRRSEIGWTLARALVRSLRVFVVLALTFA